ncbi:MAG: zinc dependent phospholipase C family protein [Candidatus Tectomicrobia bacterium]|uniref:Zinc dependent phospholipase C family protein n=1 Tax=Tectimicrobiota bacterium TaxID=2528274 RepID=A0A932FVV5_UNCTE|nr:zinc dependent phospholipase C family protein [Candidatus Tectomicrobia bacterium]
MKGLNVLIASLFWSLFFSLSPQPVSSAPAQVHLQIVRDVLELSPSGLKTYLTDFQRGLERGAVFADSLPATFFARHHDPAQVLERIDELTKGLDAKIWEQEATQYNIAVLFGVLSHYVVDAYLPGRAVLSHAGAFPTVTFEGFEGVPIPSELVAKGMGWRQEQRREGKRDEEILGEAYNRAVDGVANLWFSLWQAVGGDLSDAAPPGTQLRAPRKKPQKKDPPAESLPEKMKKEVGSHLTLARKRSA